MKHSITNRIVVGKTIGGFVGLSVFGIFCLLGIDLDLKFGLGLLLLYSIMGVLIGFLGQMDRHPILGFPMPWWVRGSFVGIIMHVLLILLAYDSIQAIIGQMQLSMIQSPWWGILDGICLGLVMAYVETRYAGEGPGLPIK